MIDEMRRRLRHPPRHARRTDTAPLAREGDEKIMSACIAVGARKTAGEDAAFEEAAKFPFDVRRNGPFCTFILLVISSSYLRYGGYNLIDIITSP
jgi:hypothetical protein